MRKATKNLAKGTAIGARSCLRDYLVFVNSKEGLEKEITPDDLIQQAKDDIEAVQNQLIDFYHWLTQDREVAGYKPREGNVRRSTAHEKVASKICSFYSRNRIKFDSGFSKLIPNPQETEALKSDNSLRLVKINKDTKEKYLDREPIKQFLDNLKMRDKAAALAMLSSSQDAGDLFKLTVGEFRRQKDNSRFFFDSSRIKTSGKGTTFRTFFSEEATKYVRLYLMQERPTAKDEEALFAVVNGGVKTMEPRHLSDVFSDAAKRMGLTWEEDEWNPMRPKRLRHLFSVSCDSIKPAIHPLYKKLFMGHALDENEQYTAKELDPADLELEYERVEPFLTIYGEPDKIEKLRKELTEKEDEQKARIDELNQRNADLEKKMSDLSISMVMQYSRKDELETQKRDLEKKMAEREGVVEALKENYENLSKQLDESIKELRQEIQNQREIEGAEKDLKDAPPE